MSSRSRNIEAAPGSVGENSDNQYQYTFRYKGRLKTPEEFGDMIIKSTQAGQTIRVKDVARVEMGSTCLFGVVTAQRYVVSDHDGDTDRRF